jgi:hypothetical protein
MIIMSNRSLPVGEEERRINREKVDSDETEDFERRSYRLAIGARGLRVGRWWRDDGARTKTVSLDKSTSVVLINSIKQLYSPTRVPAFERRSGRIGEGGEEKRTTSHF